MQGDLLDERIRYPQLIEPQNVAAKPRDLPGNINGTCIERSIKLDDPVNFRKTRKIRGHTNHIACPKALLTLFLPEHDTELNSPIMKLSGPSCDRTARLPQIQISEGRFIKGRKHKDLLLTRRDECG